MRLFNKAQVNARQGEIGFNCLGRCENAKQDIFQVKRSEANFGAGWVRLKVK